MTPAPSSQADAWFNPSVRVPRKDQTVRVLLHRGSDHAATFVVHHTEAWPSGASWVVDGGEHALPFGEVQMWSPNPYARPAGPTGGAAPAGGATPADAPAEPAGPAPPPAILGEALDELEQTRVLLGRIPPDGLDWSPHPTIPTLRVLASRVVRIAARIRWVLELDEVERLIEPDVPLLQTVPEIVATFAADADGVAALAGGLTADALRAPWTLMWDERTVAVLPRGQALRVYGLRPLAYHRGELAVLLAALGVQTPHPYHHWPFGGTTDRPSWAAAGPADG